MKSTAFCLAAVLNGLSLANLRGTSWVFSNDTQRYFFERYSEAGFDLGSLSAYLKGKVTSSDSELNAWFQENGWPGMNLSFPSSGVGVGSIFDLLVNWQNPGKRRPLYLKDGGKGAWHEGVQMAASSGLRAYKSGGGSPMFEIDTNQDGWRVYLAETDCFCDPLDLPERALELLARPRQPYGFNKLCFPVVQMETSVDVSWMQGMSAEGFRIDEAAKKIRLRVDDKGAHAESSFALISRGLENGVYTIDSPFMVIFHRSDCHFPPFVALCGPDVWVKKG